MNNEPNDIVELRKRVAKANELADGFDNRGNHALGAFLTGILQEYDRVVNENIALNTELTLCKRAHLARIGHVVPHDIAMQQVRTHINTTCNHMWYTDGFGPTRCFRCGLYSTEV